MSTFFFFQAEDGIRDYKVTGVQTCALPISGLWRNVGIAVPASTVERVAKELLEKGRIARAYLGLGMQSVRLPDALRRKLNLTGDAGMMVTIVEPGGPAEKAGAVIGDVLVAIDGKPVSDIGGGQAVFGGERGGETLTALFIPRGVLT